MITEDYCDFETAKLLKEKGFDEPCIWLYDKKGEKHYAGGYHSPWPNSELAADEWSCCTQAVAMKWLREVHGLFISIEPCFDYKLKHVIYLAFIQNVTDIDIFKEGRVEVASGYIVEAVYGKAIKYCLENLI